MKIFIFLIFIFPSLFGIAFAGTTRYYLVNEVVLDRHYNSEGKCDGWKTDEPDFVKAVPYKMISIKKDGSQAIVFTHQVINNKGATELTLESAQAKSDEWTSEIPESDMGRPNSEPSIDLSVFTKEGKKNV